MTVVGTCDQMCPVKEATLRVKMKRLWFFETQRTKDGRISADNDLSLCVKEYSRPAAGTARVEDELRTPEALEKTVNYLLCFLDISKHGKSWLYATNFISDRLRAVRQDIIIQQLAWQFSIPVMKKIVRYHILLGYILHTEAIQDFDPTLNDRILRSYLGDLMEYYDLVGGARMKVEDSVLLNMDEFHSYHILLNLDDQHVTLSKMKNILTVANCNNTAAKLDKKSRSKIAVSLSLCYHNGNYYRFLEESADNLTLLESCCLLYDYSQIRFSFLNILNTAFSSKSFCVPLEKLRGWLKIDTVHDACSFLETFDLRSSKGSGVNFNAKNKLVNTVVSVRDRQEFTKRFSYDELIGKKFGDGVVGNQGMNAKSIVENG